MHKSIPHLLLSIIFVLPALTAPLSASEDKNQLILPIAVRAIVNAGLCRLLFDIVKIQTTKNCNGVIETTTYKKLNFRWPIIATFCAYTAIKQSIEFFSLLEKRYMKQKLNKESNTGPIN